MTETYNIGAFLLRISGGEEMEVMQWRSRSGGDTTDPVKVVQWMLYSGGDTLDAVER